MPSTSITANTSPSANEPRSFGLLPLRGWVESIDPEVRDTISAPSAWVRVTILVAIVLGIAGVAPFARGFFSLDLMTAACSYVPTILLGVALGLLQRRGLSSRVFGLLNLTGIACFQFFAWSLVGLSEVPGSTVLASIPILLACYHGFIFVSGPNAPYVAIAIAIGALVAAVSFVEASTLPIFALGIPTAIGCSLILGANAGAQRATQLRNAAMREAIDAQILNERVEHTQVLSQALARLQGTSHDASNALSGVLFSIERLAILSHRRPLDAEASEQLGQLALDISSGLSTLRQLLQEARELNRPLLPNLEAVSVVPVVARVLEVQSARFPGVELVLDAQGAQVSSAQVSGGQVTLERVITNLICNACEGDGHSVARRVALRIVAVEQWVTVHVEDDGPGFPEAFLAAPFSQMKTTKAQGVGLGLFTCERLVRASGGTLRVANGEERGARLTLALRTT